MQPGTLYRDVFSDEDRAYLKANLEGQAKSITIDDIRERFFQYWTNVDADLGLHLRVAYAEGAGEPKVDIHEQGEK